MFGVLLVDILFFAIPVLALGFFLCSLCFYLLGRRANKRCPDTVGAAQMRTRKTLLIVSAAILCTLVLVVGGFIVLLTLAIANM